MMRNVLILLLILCTSSFGYGQMKEKNHNIFTDIAYVIPHYFLPESYQGAFDHGLSLSLGLEFKRHKISVGFSYQSKTILRETPAHPFITNMDRYLHTYFIPFKCTQKFKRFPLNFVCGMAIHFPKKVSFTETFIDGSSNTETPDIEKRPGLSLNSGLEYQLILSKNISFYSDFLVDFKFIQDWERKSPPDGNKELIWDFWSLRVSIGLRFNFETDN